MSESCVTDTMALILRLEKRKAPMKVKDIFHKAETGKVDLFVPAIVLAEIGYLSQKGRIDTNLESALNYITHLESVFVDPLTEQIIITAFSIDDVPELHDRLISASAIFRNAPLITNDPAIMASKFLMSIW